MEKTETEVLLFNFSEVYGAEEFPAWLQASGIPFRVLDFGTLEGACCYCDGQARKAILESLPAQLPPVRWLDSGDYHYLTHLLALQEKEPFHLVLIDHHPDNQPPAFEGVLSCGSWVKAAEEQNPQLKSVFTIGPEGCPADVADAWIDRRKGERVYISLDKDVMAPRYARTDWTQGTHSLDEVKRILGKLLGGRVEVAAIDICGELSPSKGAGPEDLKINRETNIQLQTFIQEHFQ